MDTGFAWGWMRIHCHWVHRYASNVVWAKLPHVGMGIACTVVAGALPLRPAGMIDEAPPAPVIIPADTMLGYVPAQGLDFFGSEFRRDYGGWHRHGRGEGRSVTQVAEPSSIVVFLAGVAALVLVRRWRR
jgi:hypothetical protein